MKKLLLGVAIASALGLVGCGGGDNIAEIKQQVKDGNSGNSQAQPYSRVLFDPAKAKLSVPNDLLFNGTTDGTLHMPGENVAAGKMPDYTDPQTAIGALDGWSTSVPFSLAVDFKDGVTIDATSAQSPGTVRIFEAIIGGPLSPKDDCKVTPAVSVCEGGAELQFGVDFVTKSGGQSLLVVPLKPFKASQGYLVVVTNALMDSNGNAVYPSTSYESVRLDVATQPLPLPAQLGLQKIINSYEKAAVAGGVTKDTIIYTAAFTTQSTDNVLETIKSLMVKTGSAKIPGISPALYGAGDALAQKGLIKAPSQAYTVANFANVHGAVLTAPYYLGEVTAATCVITAEAPTPNATNCPGLFRGFKAQGDSPITVLGALQSGILSTESFGAQFAKQAPYFGLTEYKTPANLVGMTFTIDTPVGKMSLDKARHLTKFNPMPAAVANNLDVVVTMPNLANINAVRGAMKQPLLEKPENGWPVMIYAHGITTSKETMLAFAGTMANAGIAVIGIDHPYHNSRAPSIVGGNKIDAQDDATAYLNLSSLLAARDNLRQSEADLLALRLAINGLAGGDLDVTEVSFYGHSLGGITGVPFASLANSGLIVDFATGATAPQNPYAIKATSFLAPGAGVPGFLLESKAFGDTVKKGLTASATFQAALLTQALKMNISKESLAAIAQANTPEYQALVNAVYGPFSAQFNFAAQTILDAGDPINYAMKMATNTPAIHLMEVVGEEGLSPSDLVIPNSTALPLAGTEPLIKLMALKSATETVTDADGVKVAVRFKRGHHSSMLRPNVDAKKAPTMDEMYALVEMQTQVASFIASKGKMVIITDSRVIAE
ncbi:MAG: lipase [Gammaproteobacteria bacterium]|nr:lipase [Gammaproteobacteria bacterium]